MLEFVLILFYYFTKHCDCSCLGHRAASPRREKKKLSIHDEDVKKADCKYDGANFHKIHVSTKAVPSFSVMLLAKEALLACRRPHPSFTRRLCSILPQTQTSVDTAGYGGALCS